MDSIYSAVLGMSWSSLAMGGLPLFVWLVWSWNEVRFLIPLKLRSDGANIPPGNMGLPFFGEMLSFLWYFKILRRPDDFIISKRKRYGRGVGIYKTHLFGSPSIIACDPPINKFILQSDDLFRIRWPSVDLVGRHSFVATEGETHSRLKTFVLNAINKPDSLKQITQAVQPRLISSLRSWADKGRIKASDETDKVTFQNICQLFVSLEPGPLLDEINKDIKGVVAGIRAQPFNIPGTANHHALQEENMAIREQKEGFITMDDISEMKYTRKVVEETIRMANISPVVFRQANKDVDYQGYRIPKDWQVVVWLRHLHTDPEYFPDPFHFNPDRWNASPNPGTYQVFGAGPRICAGNMLVRVQLSIFLHHLTTGYRWELINPNAKINYLPHPMPVDGAEMMFHAL